MTDHQELALDYLLSISKKIETNPNDNSILLKSHCNEIKQEIKILFQKKNSDPQDQTKLMKLYVELALDYITLGKNLKDAIRLSEKLKIKYPMIGCYLAGRAFEARNQIKEALTNYEKCLTLSQFSHTINAEIELRKILLTNKISLHIKHVSQNCLYIRQLAPGIDFFKDEGCIFEPTRRLICRATLNMAQFIYAIGDRNLKKCILINPSWDIEGILQTIRKDGFKVIASVVTTGLFECIGGYPQENSNIFETAKVSLPGLKELQRYNIPIIMHRLDADSTQMMTGIDPEKILFLDERVDFNFEQITSCPKISKQCDTNLKVEKSPIIMRLLHVPGITRGSQSLVVKHLNQTHLFGASFYYEEGISLKSEQIKFNNEIILSSAPLDSIVYPARLIKGSKIQASTLSAVLNKL